MIPVSEIMTREVLTFKEDTPIEEVATTLAGRHITGAPVVSADGHVVGIISEVDVFTKKGATAADIMSRQVISITEETGIEQAARLLNSARIRRLPVVAEGRLIGLVSRSDILDFFAHSHWTCPTCGQTERGLEAPRQCSRCQSSGFRLERADPGS